MDKYKKEMYIPRVKVKLYHFFRLELFHDPFHN